MRVLRKFLILILPFLVWEAGKPDVLRLPTFFDVIKRGKSGGKLIKGNWKAETAL